MRNFFGLGGMVCAVLFFLTSSVSYAERCSDPRHQDLLSIVNQAVGLCTYLENGRDCLRNSQICTWNAQEAGICRGKPRHLSPVPPNDQICGLYGTQNICQLNPSCEWQAVPAGCSPRPDLVARLFD